MFRRAGLVALFALCASQALPQSTPHALLWRITHPAGHPQSFLYGTVHSRDARAYRHVPAVLAVMSEVRTVAGELDLTRLDASSLSLMGAMMLPEGKELRDLYRKRDWPIVEQGLKDQFGAMSGMFMRMKPFFIMASMSGETQGDDHPEVLDAWLMRHAADQGHHIIGLETMGEQLRALDVLPLKEQAAMLLDHFRKGTYLDDLDQLLDAYAEQDLDGLWDLAVRGGGMPGKLQIALLTDRNKRMAHRMDSVLTADSTALFLVGAAHLPGSEGVIGLLRDRGYQLEVVPADHTPDMPPARRLGFGIHYTDVIDGFALDLPVPPSEEFGMEGRERTLQAADPAGRLFVTVLLHAGDGHPVDMDEWSMGGSMAGQVLHESDAPVQGMPARRMLLDDDGLMLGILLVDRSDRRVTLLVAGMAEGSGELVEQVLDSFRFTGLPE